MKLILEGCPHKRFLPYGDIADHDEPTFTCLTCYQRLRARDHPDLAIVKDYPPGVCEHQHKKPVGQALTAHRDYTDALCTDCGRVLRHPDGPGSWEDVMFYGLIIREEV